MLYDKLCGVAEWYLPDEIYQLVRKASFFEFPGRVQDVLSADDLNQAIESGRLNELFFLPYRVVAIEDDESCIILADTEDDALGIQVRRHFLEAKSPWLHGNPAIPNLPEDTLLVTWGEVEDIQHGPGDALRMKNSVRGAVFVSRKRRVVHNCFPMNPRTMEGVKLDMLNNSWSAMRELAYFNAPSRFIVERRPLIVGKRQNGNGKVNRKRGRPMIPRTDVGPIYSLLTPPEIRSLLGMNGAELDITPHWRRRHLRELHSERFTRARGKTVVVRASWVGPTEAIQGNKRYRIVLDR